MEVTVNDTPSQAIINEANKLVYVTDSKGRKLGLRRLDFLEEFRIMETVGTELSANTTYMATLIPLLHLTEIDGIPVEIPRSKRQVDAMIQRAGREGFTAAIKGIKENFGNQGNFDEQLKNE